MSAAKPALRGFFARQVKRDLVISFAIGIVACTAFRQLYAEPIKHAYAEYYKTYDAQEHFESMRKKGYLQSADPDD